MKIGDVSSREGFWAAGKQFFRRNPGGFQGKTAPSRGQKTRRLGMLTYFKQALIVCLIYSVFYETGVVVRRVKMLQKKERAMKCMDDAHETREPQISSGVSRVWEGSGWVFAPTGGGEAAGQAPLRTQRNFF